MQIVEVNVSAGTTGCETKVIFKPVDALDTLDVTGKHHGLGTIRGVEVVDMDGCIVSDTSKHVATVRELNLGAALDLVGFE